MKIAVSGCGIAGTCVATLLARQGHQVTIFEQAETCGPVGAGIMLQPSGQEVLRRLGVLDQVEKRSTRLLGLKARLASGRTLIQLRYEALNQETYALGVHRGVLFEQLLRLCNDCRVEVVNSTHLEDYRLQNGKVTVIDREGREEDAACFADALQQTDDFQSACQQFRQQRLRKLRYYQQLARLLTPFFQSDVPLLALGRDLTLPWFPRVPWMRRRMLRTLCGLHDGWWK